jgi:hypothetical protein
MSTGGLLNEIDWRKSEKNCISLNKGLIDMGYLSFIKTNSSFIHQSTGLFWASPMTGVLITKCSSISSATM